MDRETTGKPTFSSTESEAPDERDPCPLKFGQSAHLQQSRSIVRSVNLNMAQPNHRRKKQKQKLPGVAGAKGFGEFALEARFNPSRRGHCEENSRTKVSKACIFDHPGLVMALRLEACSISIRCSDGTRGELFGSTSPPLPRTLCFLDYLFFK